MDLRTVGDPLIGVPLAAHTKERTGGYSSGGAYSHTMARWSPGETVVVLGAGATRGAEFVVSPRAGSTRSGCLPPLNADFFTQVQRITSRSHAATVTTLVKDAIEIYGANFDLTLEQYFTQLEAMLLTARQRPPSSVAPKFSVANLTAKRTLLLEALSAVLEESADVARGRSPARQDPCSFHARLVDALRAQETIISFNYDCVVDHALRTSGAGKWSARYGYCFPRPGNVVGDQVWSAPSAPAGFNKSINLLKLHGSLNWYPFPDDGDSPVRLRERPYKQRGQKLYEIVPPEYVKSTGAHPFFSRLWANAELAIRKARTIAFIGFSFTPTDLDVEALFRLALASNKVLKRVIIANPSRDHRRRIRTILSPALEGGARVVQFDSFNDLAPFLQDVLTA